MNDKLTIVVEDPNIWISYLIGSKYGSFIDFLDNENFKFIICPEYIQEIKEVTEKEKYRKWFTKEAADALISIIENKCENINIIPSPVENLRDKNDSYLINLAQQGNADILVSNDDDFKELKGKIGKTKIMTLAEFFYFYMEISKKKGFSKKP